MPKPRPDDTGHEAGWDRDVLGPMADYAAPDDACADLLRPYDPALDDHDDEEGD